MTEICKSCLVEFQVKSRMERYCAPCVERRNVAMGDFDPTATKFSATDPKVVLRHRGYKGMSGHDGIRDAE